ncbi:hypothetical protein ACFQ3W_06395 [Paenibacillus puldeungensis]|uniref:Uncharacterized protein n=1 Tax=Paenibacillus puldeungensis TaxID=696536 RepID=A0ABW3RUX4_9BACL
MNGEIHHLMLIASHANRCLVDKQLEKLKPYDDDKHYRVQFIKPNNMLKGTQTEYNTISWLQDLKNRDCKGVMILNNSKSKDERITSAFVGGGRKWSLICLFDNTKELWLPSWELENKPPNTKWQITYNLLDPDLDINLENDHVNLDELSDRLKNALSNISQLAEDIDEEFWKESFFDKALQIVEGKLVKENQLPDIYSDQAQRIINAVYSSWVFGGMGSWNDSPPYSAQLHGKEKEFSLFSDTLYETMMDCIEGAVNSYGRDKYAK